MKISKELTNYEFANAFKNTVIFSAVIFVFGVLTLIFAKRPVIGIAEIVVAAGVFIYGLISLRFRKLKFFRYMQTYSFCLEDTTKTAVKTFPEPMVVLTVDGAVCWYNDEFSQMVGRDNFYGEHIREFFPDIQLTKYIESDGFVSETMVYKDRTYKINGKTERVDREEAINTMIGLYFIDKTDELDLKRMYNDVKPVHCMVIIDNYDEVFKETPNYNHGALIGEIERCVNAWVASGGGISTRYEREKFLVIFREKEYEEVILKDKFSVLTAVRNINLENKIPVTLSIGVGKGGDSLPDNEKMARLALDMALGRGGDQAVVKTPVSYNFFGAKSREVEKSTKVKARVVAHALREAINQASNVIIMGHKSADMDAFGAAIGLFRAIKSRNKEAYIAIDRNKNNTKLLLDGFIKKSEYENGIVSGEKALNVMDKQTLLIVVDTHRRSMVEYKEVLKSAKSVVVIDHHRRSEDFIDDAVLTYHEPYASSTSELVTEILQYIQDNGRINVMEAEALYAGIYLDTKGFTFKTGVRTFEAAAYLRRMGVDPVKVRRLFKNDFKDCVKKSDIIASAKIYRDNIAIAVCGDCSEGSQVVVAQAADELLNVSGIEASFVLAKIGHKIVISGRSLDSINVQLILEKLGGGGHITIAGAQLSNSGLGIAEMQLKAAIDSVLYDD